MKKLFIIVFSITFSITGFSQIIENVDEVVPFHEGLAAIKKNNQWAFINSNGEKVIDYRDDIVKSRGKNNIKYPYFKEGRCLIRKTIDGIDFYGFIDNTGNEVISPKYLKASNFKNGYAIIVNFDEYKVGKNPILGKEIVNKILEEYIIDTSGKIIKYLYNPRKCSLSQLNDKNAPCFDSKFIGNKMVAVKNKNGTFDIHKFE
ncbi:WG repeat-containing protein [Aureibaculum marinum]|uniref:WG repeat-containing protein n=1 Tax=Aureibaculum marinum TaxID=2487930 RepID=A0A3N4P4T2_9FLAO|nr:WG repeat-containing protein [Aureibaculum marinum]RPD98749.1 WG repeat-containing protein [Aureibaculum marinum]